MTPVERRRLPSKPSPLTGRAIVLVLLVGAAIWAFARTGAAPGDVMPTRGGLAVAGAFLSRAVAPALTNESDVPPGTVPLVWKAFAAARTTVTFAAAAMSLALVGGFALAFLASSAWWAPRPGSGRAGGRSGRRPFFGACAAAAAPVAYGFTRVLIAFLRSIHELLWAVLLLAAFGLSPFTAVLAIAVPYTGVLAKVFSEMIDEAPRDAAAALRDSGASALQVFSFALLPRALPDMTAYAFYRFECALRSSAILGFFGFPTLGYFIAASFENLLYGEVWTYLYALFALVALADWWSGALRRRFVV
jgi:phosphonate transport system permease protein